MFELNVVHMCDPHIVQVVHLYQSLEEGVLWVSLTLRMFTLACICFDAWLLVVQQQKLGLGSEASQCTLLCHNIVSVLIWLGYSAFCLGTGLFV